MLLAFWETGKQDKPPVDGASNRIGLLEMTKNPKYSTSLACLKTLNRGLHSTQAQSPHEQGAEDGEVWSKTVQISPWEGSSLILNQKQQSSVCSFMQ